MPGIDPRAMASLFDTQRGGVLDFFNTFSGGSLERMSIIALGVMPYITASIVVQLGATLYQPWQALKKEGETGRKKLNQYTRYLTVLLTTVQGYWIAVGLESLGAAQGIGAVVEPGMMFRVAATISLVGGTLFLMWIGEQITSRGIGNGVSLIIMAGIVATLPQALAQLFEGGRSGTMDPLLVATIVAIAVGLVLFICFVERAQRRVPIQYPKRQTARGMMQPERSHLPIKINIAGVIPPIFASSLLLMPLTVLQMAGASSNPDFGRLADHDQHLPAAWLAGLSAALRRGHRLLLLLLLGCSVQQRGDRREFEAPRRLHPGRPSGQGDRDLFRPSDHARDGGRRRLSRPDLPHSGDPVQPGGRALLPGRNQPAHRRQRDDGHGRADPEPPDRPPIWRPHQEGEAEDQPQALICGLRGAPQC